MNDRRLSSIWLIGAAIPAGLFFVPSIKGDPSVESRSGPILTIRGHSFRDLDRNGRLDVYEDWRLPPARRADDLIARMTSAEKAATMLQVSLPTVDAGVGTATGETAKRYDLARVTVLVRHRGITRFVSPPALPPGGLAEHNNAVQAIAETTRLGIPITITAAPIATPASTGGVKGTRIDASVRPIMIAKFVAGLFENPYVDSVAAERAGCRSNCRP